MSEMRFWAFFPSEQNVTYGTLRNDERKSDIKVFRSFFPTPSHPPPHYRTDERPSTRVTDTRVRKALQSIPE